MIFTEREKHEMYIAAGFRWRSEKTFVTEGITPNLTATVYAEWLEKILK
jgi:hypothetical protein